MWQCSPLLFDFKIFYSGTNSTLGTFDFVSHIIHLSSVLVLLADDRLRGFVLGFIGTLRFTGSFLWACLLRSSSVLLSRFPFAVFSIVVQKNQLSHLSGDSVLVPLKLRTGSEDPRITDQIRNM